MDSSYPKTLEAVAAFEGSAWAVADALVEEIAVNENGNVRQGEWPRVQKYLAEHGYEVTTDWLSKLYAVATWAATDSGLESEIRSYAPRSVRAAMQNAKGDHGFALEILAKHGGKLHAIMGSDPVGDVRKLTDEQVDGLMEKLSIHRPKAVAKAVKVSPKVQREVASDATTMHELSEHRMADAIARHREQHVEPTAADALESPELRERLRAINTEAGEFAVIREGLRRFSEADPEKIAERYIRIGAGLSVTVSVMESVEAKAGVVKDRLTAAVMQKENV